MPVGGRSTKMMAGGLIAALALAMLNQPAPPPPPPPAAPAAPAQQPVNNPLPGQLGAGALPLPLTALAVEALALTPPGTTPVAVFPPYSSPRTL